MNFDGSNQTRLTDKPGIDMSPKWSPDGRILFISNRDGQGDIYLMDGDGANVTRLTQVQAGQAAWSPDGTKVAFVKHSFERVAGQNLLQKKVASEFPLEIYVIDADGGNMRMITRSPTSTGVPCWSRDGASIAFLIDYLADSGNIFQIDLDGRNLRRLTVGPKFDSRPAFSPDGSKLAFHSNRDGNYDIYVMSLR